MVSTILFLAGLLVSIVLIGLCVVAVIVVIYSIIAVIDGRKNCYDYDDVYPFYGEDDE